MYSPIFGIDEADIENALHEEEKMPSITQGQLNLIASKTAEYLMDELGDSFWNVFDECLRQAMLETLEIEEE